jgi:hypothetical protein
MHGLGDEAMTIQEVLLPLFLEVILTFVLLFWLAPLRGRDFSSGVTRPEDVALREPNWSQRSLQVSYSYSNQFELPVLFYVLTILAYFTRHAGILFVVLAWIFVIFRYLQAYVHVTNNRLLSGLNAQYLKYISQAAVTEVPSGVPSRGCWI